MNFPAIAGLILLIAPIISIGLLIAYLLERDDGSATFLSFVWYGGAHISPMPIYFGLMAIAGAYLLKKGQNSN